jgi:hypothetical protein
MTSSTQRARIVDALLGRGWEITGTDDGAWWADEIVFLRSMSSPTGARLVLTFLVDPQHDGPRKPGERVWAVVAAKQPAQDRAAAERSGPLLSLGIRWEASLGEFLIAVEKLRA